MVNRFCAQCGAKLLPQARFCAQCGEPLGGSAAALRPRWRLERAAPVLVVGAVLGVAGLTVLAGSRSAAPPNVPPPRAAGGAPPLPEGAATMPEGHPPIGVPDDVRQVITRLAEAAKNAPDDLQVWQQLGFVQYRAGQVDPTYLKDADATYTHILTKEPENLDALRTLGNVAYDRNDPQRAKDFYERYLKLKPDDLSVQTDLGTMLLASEQVDAALKSYQNVLAIDPNFFQAQFNLAIAYRAAGQTDKAVAALERAREIAPDDATKQRVNTVLARVTGAPEPAAAPAPPQVAQSDLHGDVETLFRMHQITGPKLDRVEWPDARSARVVLREFPMETMPPFAREKFVERIKTTVRESKRKHQVAETVQIQLVDAASGKVMETVSE
jgi:Flp pilus assembly protein TadD